MTMAFSAIKDFPIFEGKNFAISRVLTSNISALITKTISHLESKIILIQNASVTLKLIRLNRQTGRQ